MKSTPAWDAVFDFGDAVGETQLHSDYGQAFFTTGTASNSIHEY